MKPTVLVDDARGMFREYFHEEAAKLLHEAANVLIGSAEHMKEEHGDAIALVTGLLPVDEPFLQHFSVLKLVARFGVGYDAVDVSACTRRGVYVTHTPHALSEAVADLTLALILGLARNIIRANHYARTEWTSDPKFFSYGVDLQAKTLGIVGLGRIGFQVAKRAHAFDMKLLYTDLVAHRETETTFGAKRVPLTELLQTADFVSLHVPLTEKTRGLIGSPELELMKPTAYLINTSRGAVVDQQALTESLRTGRIRGAGLDVFDPEPAPSDDPILALPNVLATPHIASATVETRRRMTLSCINEILRILRGDPPVNVVPEQKGLLF